MFNLLRQIILLIPLVYILPNFFGLMGIWLAGPVSDLGASVVTAWFVTREIKNLERRAAALRTPAQLN